MHLCVIGTGYVGLVGAAVFADWGNHVVGVDIDAKKIESIKNGIMPIYEPGLAELVTNTMKSGRLSFTTSLEQGLKDAEIVFICVGTPQSYDGTADLNYVWEVAKNIGKLLKDYKVIVTKSTVPVGTNEKVKKIVKENLTKDVDFDVASNPEFLREGSSIEDMNHTDRTVIGSDSQKALKIMAQLYSHLESPIVECDLRSAELIKYASNTFLVAKISFINEIAQLCERVGADVSLVAKGMGLDRRIGEPFLNAGIGYGGSCFPKDVIALYKTSMEYSYDFRILRSAMQANDAQQGYFVEKVIKRFGENLSGITIACLGLAFKSNTDDIRSSVAIKVVRLLRGHGAKLHVFDPQAMENAKHVLKDGNLVYCANEYEAAKGADALCILTEWSQFKQLDLEKLKSTMSGNIIFDGRNMLDPKLVKQAGFAYSGVGKRASFIELVEKV